MRGCSHPRHPSHSSQLTDFVAAHASTSSMVGVRVRLTATGCRSRGHARSRPRRVRSTTFPASHPPQHALVTRLTGFAHASPNGPVPPHGPRRAHLATNMLRRKIIHTLLPAKGHPKASMSFRSRQIVPNSLLRLPPVRCQSNDYRMLPAGCRDVRNGRTGAFISSQILMIERPPISNVQINGPLATILAFA